MNGLSLDLIRLLREIERGRHTFRPSGDGEENLQQFQPVVQLLQEAESRQLVGGLQLHKESTSGCRLYDLATVHGLTEKGYAVLNSSNN